MTTRKVMPSRSRLNDLTQGPVDKLADFTTRLIEFIAEFVPVDAQFPEPVTASSEALTVAKLETATDADAQRVAHYPPLHRDVLVLQMTLARARKLPAQIDPYPIGRLEAKLERAQQLWEDEKRAALTASIFRAQATALIASLEPPCDPCGHDQPTGALIVGLNQGA